MGDFWVSDVRRVGWPRAQLPKIPVIRLDLAHTVCVTTIITQLTTLEAAPDLLSSPYFFLCLRAMRRGVRDLVD